MIKKQFDLIPISRSVKALNSGMLVQKTSTGQLGTIRATGIKSRQARRLLIDSFEPVSLYIVDPTSTIIPEDFVIFTFKSGEKLSGRRYEFSGDIIVKAEKIIIYPGDLLNAWVKVSPETIRMIPYIADSTISQDGFTKFKHLTVTSIKLLLAMGGKVWIEMIENSIRLHRRYPVIHLHN